MKKLFSEFPDITTEAWEDKIRADLRDSEALKKLIWQSEEGIPIKPFYRGDDLGASDYLQRIQELRKSGTTPNSWTICQDVFPGKDRGSMHSRIKEALKGGADAIRLHYSGAADPDISELKTLIREIPLKDTELLFQGTMRADSIYQILTEKAAEVSIPASELHGCLGADPIGYMVTSGIPIASLENLARLVDETTRKSPSVRVIDINGASIQNAGGNLVQELAFTLAMGSDYLAFMTGKGMDPSQIENSIQLSFAVGPSIFMEIAKLRAARILWSALAGAYGMDPKTGVVIHSTSSTWNLTLYDPYVNMLRGTTEAIAAILGGADKLTVLPFDFAYGASSSFSDRIARNMQIIMREEAYLDRVADPASGSYYIEILTDAICDKAWSLFQEVETMGGFRKAFETGWIQEQVSTSKRKKLEKYSSGKDKLIGSNAFPDFNEAILEQVTSQMEEPSHESALLPLIPFRPSAHFEKVRLATEQSSVRPKVLLFKYGAPAWAQARATFSGNFFGCAGYEILDYPPFNSIKDGINLAHNVKPEVIVLCSSDNEYLSFAGRVFQECHGESLIVIAGSPSENMEEMKSSGIEHFIHQKSNILEKLEAFNSILLSKNVL
jgi:methylmalonyl-CoA mutase